MAGLRSGTWVRFKDWYLQGEQHGQCWNNITSWRHHENEKKGIRLRSHQGWCQVESWPESDWLNWHNLLVEVEVCVVVVAMLGHMTLFFQKCYSITLTFINVISFANSISLLYHRQQVKASIGWLWLPPAVWEKYLQAFATREQINQLLFVCSCHFSWLYNIDCNLSVFTVWTEGGVLPSSLHICRTSNTISTERLCILSNTRQSKSGPSLLSPARQRHSNSA